MFPKDYTSRTGRHGGRSFEPWSSKSKSMRGRSASCIGSVPPLLNVAPNKVVCNIVGGVISPLLSNIYLNLLDHLIASGASR